MKVRFLSYTVSLNARDGNAKLNSHFPGHCEFTPRTEVDPSHGMGRILINLEQGTDVDRSHRKKLSMMYDNQ